VEARTWVKKLAEEHDVREEEKEDCGAHINNLVELGFFFKYFTCD
jgi:hypothetical protein